MVVPNPLPIHLYKILTTNPSTDCSNLQLPDLDYTDGFIHLSTDIQTPQTATRFFRDQFKIWILKIRYEQVKEHVRWEEARSHGTFAHVYVEKVDDEESSSSSSKKEGEEGAEKKEEGGGDGGDEKKGDGRLEAILKREGVVQNVIELERKQGEEWAQIVTEAVKE